MCRASLLPAERAAALVSRAPSSARCLPSSRCPDALLWSNNPFSACTRVSIKMTEVSAALPQGDEGLLAKRSFLVSCNSFCFVLATALRCLLLLKNSEQPARAVGDSVHPEGVGPGGLSGSIQTQRILRFSAGEAAGSADTHICARVCLQSCLVSRLGFLLFGKNFWFQFCPLCLL